MSANTTLKQVATRAGVAWSTASYAINGGPKPVSDETRERVLQAARELGYSSNLLARGLVTGRGTMIGVLVPEMHSHLTSYQLSGVEEAAQQLGYIIMLSVYRSEIDSALLAQRNMAARRMEGIVCLFDTAGSLNGRLDGILTGLAEMDLPFVSTCHDPIAGVETDCFLVDHEQGGYLATCHLLEMGRRAIAFAGPPHLNAGRDRLAGYHRAHDEFGLRPHEELIMAPSACIAHLGEEVGEELFSRSLRPDAVFAASDNLAAGMLRSLRRRGMSVPDDVALVGFDDNPPLCDALDPPLTSVHCPLEEIGRASVHRLIERLNDPQNWCPQIRTLPCTLTGRQSA
ncbi:MAG: LacI family transcriptional regulator [Armatimonadetes bacterium]|nr:LacI family transcriptional regulator [Armatimonadota bacterium]